VVCDNSEKRVAVQLFQRAKVIIFSELANYSSIFLVNNGKVLCCVSSLSEQQGVGHLVKRLFARQKNTYVEEMDTLNWYGRKNMVKITFLWYFLTKNEYLGGKYLENAKKRCTFAP